MCFLPSMPIVLFDHQVTSLSEIWKPINQWDFSLLRSATPWICRFIFLGFFLRICFPSDSRFWLVSPWPSFRSLTFALGGAAPAPGYLGLKYVTAHCTCCCTPPHLCKFTLHQTARLHNPLSYNELYLTQLHM